MLERMLKLLAALVSLQGIALLTQLLLPSLFLRNYGMSAYGEWIVLSSAVTYLGTLNFGITTYASNEMTMLYHRGEMEAYHRLQSSSLVLLSSILGLAAVLLSGVFALPVSRILRLHMPVREAATTVFFFGCSALVAIAIEYVSSMFMVVGRLARGSAWRNAQALLNTLVLTALLLKHQPFSVLAGATLVVSVLAFSACTIDFFRIAPELKLSFRQWHWPTAQASLKPSGMFGLIFLQNILVFQVPVLFLQRLLGGSSVAVFAFMRTIFSMVRQMTTALGSSMGPEITRSYGGGEWPTLMRLYHMSEKLIFTLAIVCNLGVLALSPVLLVVWLHKPGLFTASNYALMALTSAVMSIKDHKFFFQYCTNEHRELALISFISYLLMCVAAYPLIIFFGITGLLSAWLVAEISQVFLIYRLNRQLFNYDASVTLYPVYRFFAITLLAVPLCSWLAQRGAKWPKIELTAAAAGAMIVLFSACYALFHLGQLRELMGKKLSAMLRPEGPEAVV